jgi:hypothetical protein
MSEQQTKYPHGVLSEKEERKLDLHDIQEYFAQLVFGTTIVTFLPKGEIAHPMLAETPDGKKSVMRWRHDIFLPEEGIKRGDTYFFVQGLGEAATVLAFNVSLEHEKELEAKGDFSRLISERQDNLDKLMSDGSDVIMWEADLRDVRQFLHVASGAVAQGRTA